MLRANNPRLLASTSHIRIFYHFTSLQLESTFHQTLSRFFSPSQPSYLVHQHKQIHLHLVKLDRRRCQSTFYLTLQLFCLPLLLLSILPRKLNHSRFFFYLCFCHDTRIIHHFVIHRFAHRKCIHLSLKLLKCPAFHPL